MIAPHFRPLLARRLASLRRLAAVAVLLPLAASAARAHAVVFPKTSATGAHERYVLRVPNEKAVATTRVEIHFPAGLKVSAFSDVAGWQLEVQRDSAGAIVGAVWTGTLPPQRFVEFPFVATNPKSDVRLVWPTFQTYADGERVEWVGPEGSKRPASATAIGAAPGADAAGARGASFPLAVAALVLSLIALGLALRPRATTHAA